MAPFFRSLKQAVTVGQRPRAYPRVMISEPVRIDTPRAIEQKAMLEDISVGGACVRTHAKLRPGEAVSLLLSLGINKRVDARARVVYAHNGGAGYQMRYGVRFVGLGEDEANKISDYVVEQKFGRQFGVRSFQSSFEREQS